MIRICSRYAGDADGAGSIYNDAMLRIFRNIGSYHEEGKLAAWIKTIVIHCCIDFCKKKNIFTNAVSYSATDDIEIEPAAFDNISAREIQQAISQLPGATAVVFRLFIYEGLTHKQISGCLAISEGTSKWHVSEAKKALKKRFKPAHKYFSTVYN
jgi:RNA polymerase sigma factor (sigma-70 family)